MRYRDGFISTAVGIVLSAAMLAGTAYTDQFPQAARAESVGFDALAHQVFHGIGHNPGAAAPVVQ